MAKKVQIKNTMRLEALVAEQVMLKDISPNAYNPNRQSDFDFELMCRSIIEDGFTQSVLVQKTGNQIIDGEHRWTGMIVINSLLADGWTFDKLKTELPSDELRVRRRDRLKHLERVGDAPISIVRTDMTPEQMRIATLRHNRARGDEDIELSAALLRDLQALGAIEHAKDSLMLSDEEINRMVSDMSVSEALSGDEFSAAWEPQQRRAGETVSTGETQTEETEHGRVSSAASREAIEAQRDRERKLDEAKTEEERQKVRDESKTYRINLVFGGGEAELVDGYLGRYAAENLIKILRFVEDKGLKAELEKLLAAPSQG